MTVQVERATGGVGLERGVGALDWVIIVLLTILLVYLPAAFGTGEPWSEFVAMCIGGSIATALAARVLLKPPRFGPASAPVAAFVALAVLQLAPLSRPLVERLSPQTVHTKADLLGDLPDAREALDPMTLSFYPLAGEDDLRIVLLATTVLAAVTVCCRSPRRITAMLTIVALIGGAEAALALAQDVTQTNKIYWTVDLGARASSGTFANHSHFGQFTNLAIGAALALLLMRPRSIWPAAVIVLGALTVSLSLTRGGMISMLAAGSFTIVVIVLQGNLRQMGAVLCTLGVVALIALLYYGFDRVYERMLDPHGLGTRFMLVRDTLEMYRHFPLTGVGLGAFQWVFPAFDRSVAASVASHAENEYVQVLAEAGTLGFAMVMAFVAVVWARYARSLITGGKTAAAAIGLGYGLMAVMIHSLSDFGQHLPAVACFSATTCGLLLNLGSTSGLPGRGSRLLMIPAALGLVAIAIWSIHGAERSKRADAEWRRASRVAAVLDRGEWQASPEQFVPLLEAIDASVTIEPRDAHQRYWQGVYQWYALRNRLASSSASGKMDAAMLEGARRVIHVLNQSRRACATYSPAYSLLGQIEYHLLGRAIGVTHIHHAARLDPNEPATCFAAGRIDAERGKLESASRWLGRAVALDPAWFDTVIDFALDDVESADLALRAAGQNYRRIMQLASAMRERARYQEQWRPLYVLATDLLEQQCQSPDASAWDLGFLGSYRAFLGEHGKAEKYYRRALLADATNLTYRLQLVETLSAAGKVNEAIDEARLAARMHPQSSEARKLLDRLTQSENPQRP